MAAVPPEPTAVATAALAKVVAALPGGGEARPGQVRDGRGGRPRPSTARRHLVVQAGTGTGKSSATWSRPSWPASTTVVATATKALQDQLVGQDLPVPRRAPRPAVHVRRPEGPLELPVPPAGHRGRRGRRAQGTLDADGLDRRRRPSRGARALVAWGADDRRRRPGRARLRALAAGVGRGVGQRPRVPRRQHAARGRGVLRRAGPAPRPPRPTCVVVNTHLYGIHLATGGGVLPEHDVVVFDEAHQLEDIVSATAGFELGAGPVHGTWPGRRGRILADAGASPTTSRAPAIALAAALADHVGRRLEAPPTPASPTRSRSARGRLERARRRAAGHRPHRRRRRDRPQGAGPGALAGLARRHRLRRSTCRRRRRRVGRGPPAHTRCCKVAPVDVAELLARAAVATPDRPCSPAPPCPPACAERLGLPRRRHHRARRRQPVRLRRQRPPLLRRPPPRPPRPPATRRRSHDELEALIERRRRPHPRPVHQLAGHAGRRRGAARRGCPGRCCAQGELPKPALVDAFTDDESACLFATMGFWQGVDVPGRTLSLRRHRPAARSPAPTSRCSRPAASVAGPTPSASSTCPAPRRCWPRAPAA